MVTITLRGREIPLLYTCYEIKTIQEEIGPIEKAVVLLAGRNPDDDKDISRIGSAEHLNTVAKFVKILGNAWLDENGKNQDLTEKWILRGMKQEDLFPVINECMNAMAKGNESEIPENEDDGPVDVVLEEMKKKKDPES